MALSDFVRQLEQFAQAATAAFAAANDANSLELARIEFLGAKGGQLKAIQKLLGAIDKADKPEAGKQFNAVKAQIEAAFASAQSAVQATANDSDQAPIDLTLPGGHYRQDGARAQWLGRPRLGRLHPITQTIEALKEIMGRLGFSVAAGPVIEDERHNFEALNIPLEHPARDPLENFYLATAASGSASSSGELLLRSQTSTVQIRVMEQTPPPVRIISLGRVYRPDTADATHYPMFHQMEGLWVDRTVTMADLKTVLRLFATSYLGRDVHVRFRPSFFPFTEPSVEADMSWNGQWIEFGGAGMIDPSVLTAVGYDPEAVTGFAFGLGVERLCMRRYGITDIRELYRNDIRFLHQF